MSALEFFKQRLLQMLDDNGFLAVPQALEEIKKSPYQYDKPSFAELTQMALHPLLNHNNYIVQLKTFIGTLSDDVSQPFLYNIPIKPGFFIGRQEKLKQIHELLAGEAQRQNILLLSGIGGMGKTTLMQRYLHQNECRQHFKHIIYIPIDKNLETAFINNISQALGLEESRKSLKSQYEQLQLVVAKMQGYNDHNLVVIDNVNESDFDDLRRMRPFFNQTGWKYLITTRTSPDEFMTLDVDELDMDDAVLLFAYHFTRENIALTPEAEINKELQTYIQDEGIKEDAENLLNYIAKHTLLTELLAKAGKKKGLSVSQLLGRLKELDFTHPDLQRKIHVGDHALNTHRLSVTTLEVYLLNLFETEYLEQKTGDPFIDAQNLAKVTMLHFFSILPSSDMPIDHLKNLWRIDKVTENAFEDRLDDLRQIGWIQGKQETSPNTGSWQNISYKMHPLVQEVVYKKLRPDLDSCQPLIQTVTGILGEPLAYPQAYQDYARSIIEKIEMLYERYNAPAI